MGILLKSKDIVPAQDQLSPADLSLLWILLLNTDYHPDQDLPLICISLAIFLLTKFPEVSQTAFPMPKDSSTQVMRCVTESSIMSSDHHSSTLEVIDPLTCLSCLLRSLMGARIGTSSEPGRRAEFEISFTRTESEVNVQSSASFAATSGVLRISSIQSAISPKSLAVSRGLFGC